MKKMVSIIFLSLLIMKIGGYFAFLLIQQDIFKEEAKERIIHLLPNTNLTKLSFSRYQFDKIDWQEIDKEFYFNGKLYDVVRSEIKNSNHILHCLTDDAETEIYSEILQISKAHSDELPVKNTLISFLNLLNLKYTIPQIFRFESQVISRFEKPMFTNFKIIFSSIKLPFVSPPPEH